MTVTTALAGVALIVLALSTSWGAIAFALLLTVLSMFPAVGAPIVALVHVVQAVMS